ncbi:MAG: SpoIIE family protein phosphatase [Omnitrophica bacterium]|nr:SpoIIE family protein phosphatase [Candidatus Omnitrophota bacterium]
MQKKTTRLTCLFIILSLVIGAISYFRLLDTYELILLDLRFKSRPLQEVNPQIAIIEIADDTLANLGLWPLPRDYHAAVIKILSDCGASTVIFDVFFSEPTKADALLVEATRQADNVYYPYALGLKQKKGGFWRAEEFDAELLTQLAEVAKGIGHANVLTDSDGKRRRIPLFIDYRSQFMPQLSFRAACDYLNIRPEEIKFFPGKYVQLGQVRRIPIDREAATLVNLAGGWKETFKHYSYGDILIDYANRQPEQDLPPKLAELKNKVCFVGLTATGTADLSPSALEPVYPMVGLQANLFNSIVTGNFLRRPGRLANLVILYLFCLATILLSFKTRPLIGILCQLGLLVLFVAAGFLLFLLAGLWIDLFFPIMACLSVYLSTNIFRYIKELHSRELLEKELSIARDIQRSFLPQVPAGVPGTDISVEMDTAHHVGGDLYDFVKFSDGRVGLMVGDVSGKGVPAALFMAQVISQFRNFATSTSSPAETLTKLNQHISRDSKSGLFVTMAYVVYDPARRQISLASAGHLPPLLFRSSQLIEKIEVSEGIPIGLMEEAEFTQSQLNVAQGDMLLLYTDGVTEARDKKGQEITEERVIQALKDKKGLSSHQAIQALKGTIRAFVGSALQHDDITIMALRVV